jgi:hypothetical protein
VDRAGTLKAEIKVKEAELKALHDELDKACDFSDGKTAVLYGEAFKVKAQEKWATSWNQDKLKELLGKIGPDEFKKHFTYKYEPIPRGQLEAKIDYLPFRDDLVQCFTKKRGSTYFVYEPMESA